MWTAAINQKGSNMYFHKNFKKVFHVPAGQMQIFL